jgi:hypothetical protein
MGVGLYLGGHCDGDGKRAPTPAGLLQRVERWMLANADGLLTWSEHGKDRDGKPTLLLRLHPAGEPLEITALGKGRLLASTKTSPVGPGYHAYLCDLLRRLGSDFAVTWDPPDGESGAGTRYFHDGDRSALEREFLQWLRSTAAIVHENASKGGWHSVSMPAGHRYETDGQVVTPMGFRDAAWFAAVAADPAKGTDIFPWWKEGQRVEYLLSRALCLMWTEVRWRPPIADDEVTLYEDVIGLLHKAYDLDPQRDYPWREWREMDRHFEDAFGYKQSAPRVAAEVARRAAKVRNGPLIGYRRRPVTVDLPPRWSITIPGSFAETWENKHTTWSAWDSVCSVWVTTYTFLNKDGTPLSAAETLAQSRDRPGERFDYRRGKVIGRAFLEYVRQDEEDEGEVSYWRLCGRSAAAGHLAGFTICFTDPAYRQWALDTWHTIQHA